jgi:hypothetical protein
VPALQQVPTRVDVDVVVDVDRNIRQSPDSQDHLAARICWFFVHVYVHEEDDDQVDGGFSRNRTFSPKTNLSGIS